MKLSHVKLALFDFPSLANSGCNTEVKESGASRAER